MLMRMGELFIARDIVVVLKMIGNFCRYTFSRFEQM